MFRIVRSLTWSFRAASAVVKSSSIDGNYRQVGKAVKVWRTIVRSAGTDSGVRCPLRGASSFITGPAAGGSRPQPYPKTEAKRPPRRSRSPPGLKKFFSKTGPSRSFLRGELCAGSLFSALLATGGGGLALYVERIYGPGLAVFGVSGHGCRARWIWRAGPLVGGLALPGDSGSKKKSPPGWRARCMGRYGPILRAWGRCVGHRRRGAGRLGLSRVFR